MRTRFTLPGSLRHRTLALPAALASALLLTACGSGDSPTPEASAADSVTVTDAWVKAADEGMTSAFGRVDNEGEDEVTLVAVESEASADVELHTTTEDGSGGMSMEEQEGGFPIQPQEILVLEPGAQHIMLMDLAEPLEHGTTTQLTLVFSDDSRVEVTADVRDFAGAQENYGGMDDEHGGSTEDEDGGSADEHDGHDSDRGHEEHGEHGGHGADSSEEHESGFGDESA